VTGDPKLLEATANNIKPANLDQEEIKELSASETEDIEDIFETALSS
jgi:hypothetical protein